MVALNAPPEARTVGEATVKHAVRYCDTAELALYVSSLAMHGRDREIVAVSDAFAEECGAAVQIDGMVDRARRSLTRSSPAPAPAPRPPPRPR
jgi:hypothetical protein